MRRSVGPGPPVHPGRQRPGDREPRELCGSGAVWSGAASEVRRLADPLGAPVFTTPGGRGIIGEDDPLSLGQVGLYFTALGKRYYDEADLILSIGSRLEAFSSNSWAYWPKGARLIQVTSNRSGSIGGLMLASWATPCSPSLNSAGHCRRSTAMRVVSGSTVSPW